jgi:succinate-semialdehyde dehydrogenase/glutarate-semialdehyde dehydrogenase
MQSLKVGDPLDERTEIGPLATPKILEDLDDQVRRTVAAGARTVTGGRRLERPGNFYEPTVLVDVSESSPAAREELFGPVAPLLRARDASDAIRIANSTTFGLGAAAWTSDEKERDRFINELESGTVAINGMVASDPRLPFGGVKQSGYGRELSREGIREFVNVKTVRVGATITGRTE